MTRKTLLAACATLALTAGPAWAQLATDPAPIVVAPEPDVVVVTPEPDPVVVPPETDVVVVAPEPPPPPSNAGAFDALSPGGQKIARALFAAQGGAVPVTTAAGTTASAGAWTLDDIASARGQGGWGQVFKQMQADGLVAGKNLGQVVSGHAAATMPVTAPAPTPVVVSYGDSGTVMAAAPGKGHKPVIVTADGAATSAGAAPKAMAKAHVSTGGGGHHAASVAATTVKANGAAHAAGGGGGGKSHGNKHGK